MATAIEMGAVLRDEFEEIVEDLQDAGRFGRFGEVLGVEGGGEVLFEGGLGNHRVYLTSLPTSLLHLFN